MDPSFFLGPSSKNATKRYQGRAAKARYQNATKSNPWGRRVCRLENAETLPKPEKSATRGKIRGPESLARQGFPGPPPFG